VLSTKGSGLIIRRAGKELFGMLKETFMLASLWQTKQMDSENILMSTVVDIPVSGLMMSKKAKVKKSGLMAPNTTESIRMAASTVTAYTIGEMEASSAATGMITK